MDIRTRITEFIEKRSKNKVTTIKEARPSSPWWRRFSRFRRFFIRKKKNKISPMVDNSASVTKDGNSTSEVSQSPGLIRRVARRKGLFRSKSESFVKDHRPEDPSRSQVDSSRDSGIADTSGEGTTTTSRHSSRKSVAWSVSFLSDGVEENGTAKDALPKNGGFVKKESPMNPRVLWKLVNADSSVLNEDEWASFQDNDAIDEEGEQNQYSLSNNLQSLEDYSEEMTYMLHRATITWSNICRGPFPDLKNHTKDQVVELMSRGCVDSTDRIITKFDAIIQDVNHLIGEIDDHLGLQIDFKDRIQHDQDLKSKRPGMIDLAWSYLKPKGFPTGKYKDSLDMVVEEVDDAETDNL